MSDKSNELVWSAMDMQTTGAISNAEAGAQSIALIISSFFKELIRQNLTRDEAIILTAKYFEFILSQGKGKDAGN